MIVLNLINAGIDVENHHHEVATAGQSEIDFKYEKLIPCCDALQMFKYIVKIQRALQGKQRLLCQNLSLGTTVAECTFT